MAAPDFAAPILGWRAWRVAETEAGHRLASVMYDDAWHPGAPFTARCHAAGAHSAPDCSCACGVYAVRSTVAAARYLTGRNDGPVVDRVIGLVALWGVVYEGTTGWRASTAYPHRLWLRDGADALASDLSVYGAGVNLCEARELRLLLRELADEPLFSGAPQG